MSEVFLITGANGFVGKHLRRALESAGQVVYSHERATGDIARCLIEHKDVTHVFHLAGKTYVPDSWISPVAFYETNVLGTVNVMDFCRRSGAAVTFVSSYVYGIPDRLPISENHPTRALNPYSHTKILAEQVVRFYESQFGCRATIVRPFNIYGPGQGEQFLIPTLVRQALDPAATEIVVNDLRPRRDYIHVRDLVAMLTMTAARCPGGVFNAGSGHSVSIGELVDAIASATGSPKPVRSRGQARPEEVLDVVADISKAKNEFDWNPRVPLREGIEEIVAAAGAGGIHR